LGLELFGSSYDDEALKMERQLRTAAAKDRKRLKQGNRITKIIMGTVMGNADIEVPSLYRNQMLIWIDIIRSRFLGIVIRRTIWSIDYQGARISGLAPFKEHNLLVKLYSHEVENLELIAKDLVEEGSTRAAKFASGSVPFLSISNQRADKLNFYRIFTCAFAGHYCTQAATMDIYGPIPQIWMSGRRTPLANLMSWRK
jgi:hypothetical protein